MRRLFLADVHLSPREPARTARFGEFLRHECRTGDELYILGDLFDYWIGPKHLDLADYGEVFRMLRETVDGGVRVFFIIGNRDFYMFGGRFEHRTGLHIADGRVEHALVAGGKSVYLCHGDYLEGRTGGGYRIQEMIRTRAAERFFVRLPAMVTDAMARFYRWLSARKGKARRPHAPSPDVVREKFRLGADIIVCGHYHEPRQENVEVDGRQRTLYILGDWSEGTSYLVEEDGQWRLCSQNLPG
jgi:UDP-2,3-diacylglucosamine hydrolase